MHTTDTSSSPIVPAIHQPQSQHPQSKPQLALDVPPTVPPSLSPLRRIRRLVHARRTRLSCPRSPLPRRQVRSPQPNGRDVPPPSIPSSTTFGARLPPSSPSGGPHAVPEDLQFALEALHNLTTYCPDWARRLDELSGQIDQRQVDLAQFAEQQSRGPRRATSDKSPRNRPSTESLKPKDDGAAHPTTDDEDATAAPDEASPVQCLDHKRASALTDGFPAPAQNEPSSSNLEANSPTSSAVERQTPQVVAFASANARANLRRSQLNRKRAAAAESVLTGDGAVATKYRNRNLVIVYYDSYVQSFFEEVVKFVSASRNLMRKAKMAAKVAQIKRMAELEMPDDDDDEPGSDDALGIGLGSGTASFAPPQLSPSTLHPDEPLGGTVGTEGEKGGGTAGEKNGVYKPIAATNPERAGTAGMLAAISSNRLSYLRADGNGTGIAHDKDLSPSSPKLSTPFRSSLGWSSSFSTYGAGSDPRRPPDVFDELDKGLEAVQSMCEHAAHQFLRDGDCADEIVKIKERLTGTKASADKELERRLADDPNGSLKKLLADGPTRSRTYRPQSMRRDASLAGAAARLKTNFAGAGAGPDSKTGVIGAGGGANAMTLEVDEGNGDVDMNTETPRFQFRSTRAMGPRAATGS